jgi:hypothetical protein
MMDIAQKNSLFGVKQQSLTHIETNAIEDKQVESIYLQ